MKTISAALYGYSIINYLRNRNSGERVDSPYTPATIRRLSEENTNYLLTQRDITHNLDYSKYLQIIDTRFWYLRAQGAVIRYQADATITLKNISPYKLLIFGLVADWKLGTYYSESPMFTLKPVSIEPGKSADIIICSQPFQYLYEDGKEFTLSDVELRKRVKWTDTTYRESILDIVLLNISIFVCLDNNELVYRELKPYNCKIKLSEVLYNADDLRLYTGYSSKQGAANLNTIKLWKSKGYDGLPFKRPKEGSIVSDEEYNKIIDDYKNVDE